MSEPAQTGAFSMRSGLLLVAGGAALFLALLWMIGTGYGFDNSNDGGSHAGGKGLNGFAGLVRLAAADGWATTLARSDAELDQPGLLVLTPAADAPGTEISRIVSRHRRIGPVMVIAPKWLAQRLARDVPGGKDGWVALAGVQPPQWPGFLDKVSVSVRAGAQGAMLRWRAAQLTGRLPDARAIEAGTGADDAGRSLIPLVGVAGGMDGRALPPRNPPPLGEVARAARRRRCAGRNIDQTGDCLLVGPLRQPHGLPPPPQGEDYSAPVLAAYVADARPTPALDRLALDGARATAAAPPSSAYPLVLVFEPDLLDNYGLADPANAALASRLLAATAPGGPRAIAFDLTLDGLGHAPNLLTLAFAPPWLAATLCLILAALAAGWRSFCRFGTPRAAPRELAFGKARLVENSGALILRARRLHLLGPRYAAACRERIARGLALPRHADVADTDAAIDRALAARRNAGPGTGRGFAETVAALHEARGQTAMVAAARALHQLERMLIR